MNFKIIVSSKMNATQLSFLLCALGDAVNCLSSFVKMSEFHMLHSIQLKTHLPQCIAKQIALIKRQPEMS